MIFILKVDFGNMITIENTNKKTNLVNRGKSYGFVLILFDLRPTFWFNLIKPDRKL